MKKLLLLVVLLAIPFKSVYAEEKNEALESFANQLAFAKYFNENEQRHIRCNIALTTSDDLFGCISKAESESKVRLNEMLGKLKKRSAKDALKNYHIAFITALKGIEPGNNERRFAYDQRQQTLKSKIDEAQARFDLEND